MHHHGMLSQKFYYHILTWLHMPGVPNKKASVRDLNSSINTVYSVQLPMQFNAAFFRPRYKKNSESSVCHDKKIWQLCAAQFHNVLAAIHLLLSELKIKKFPKGDKPRSHMYTFRNKEGKVPSMTFQVPSALISLPILETNA